MSLKIPRLVVNRFARKRGPRIHGEPGFTPGTRLVEPSDDTTYVVGSQGEWRRDPPKARKER